MFWSAARRKYGRLDSQDPDISKYLAMPGNYQEQGYQGLVGQISDLGHRWVAARTPAGPVLEIGFGAGRHKQFFSGKAEDYFVSEYNAKYMSSAVWNQVRGRGLQCDARTLPFASLTFNSVISIYNLEHIPDLQSVLDEGHRVLQANGKFLVALPCEGGLLWNLGREISTRRAFQKQYGINYDKIIAFEHVWNLAGVMQEIRKSGRFTVDTFQLLPTRLPTVHLNLVACLSCSKVSQ